MENFLEIIYSKERIGPRMSVDIRCWCIHNIVSVIRNEVLCLSNTAVKCMGII